LWGFIYGLQAGIGHGNGKGIAKGIETIFYESRRQQDSLTGLASTTLSGSPFPSGHHAVDLNLG